MDRNKYELHGYIIEKVEDFLKHDKLSELYRYLKLTGEDLDVLVKEIEEKITGEEEKKKIILLKNYIRRREKLEKDIELINKKTSEDLFNTLDDEKSKDEFDKKIIKAFNTLEAGELYNFLNKLYIGKNFKDKVRDIENRLTGRIDAKKLKEFIAYVDKMEYLEKKPKKIKENNSKEIQHDAMREGFEQFGRLSKLFSNWKKNPDSKFGEEYQKIFGGEVSGNNAETPNIEKVEVRKADESENLSGDNPIKSIESNTGLLKEYCLFNLLDRKSDQGFTLSKFINQNNVSLGERTSMDYDLINAISNISLDNFCEQEGFYRGVLFDPNDIISSDGGQSNISNQGVVDFSQIKLMNLSSMKCEECMKKIRNSIAHGDFMYLTEDTGVTIYINDKNGFEAFINPSFFDDGFCFGQYASDISCDFILLGNNEKPRKENIYEYRNGGEKTPKLVNFLGQNFKENLTTVLDDKYNAVRINLNQQKWIKEMEIIDSEKTQEPGLLFGLLSENERSYVHNLLNAISISILNKILRNPNISYNELLDNLAVETIGFERNLFTFQDRDKIIKLCLDMLPDLLILQGLKIFYINILKIPENDRTLEEKRQAHIRNALVHGYYKIIRGKIILWDEKINKETGGRDISLEKDIYDIETLRNKAKEYEKFYHSRKNGFESFVKGTWLAKKI